MKESRPVGELNPLHSVKSHAEIAIPFNSKQSDVANHGRNACPPPNQASFEPVATLNCYHSNVEQTESFLPISLYPRLRVPPRLSISRWRSYQQRSGRFEPGFKITLATSSSLVSSSMRNFFRASSWYREATIDSVAFPSQSSPRDDPNVSASETVRVLSPAVCPGTYLFSPDPF